MCMKQNGYTQTSLSKAIREKYNLPLLNLNTNEKVAKVEKSAKSAKSTKASKVDKSDKAIS